MAERPADSAQPIGQRPVGGQMKVCEENQIIAQKPVLILYRLLDLDHHLRHPDLFRRRHDVRTGRDKRRILETAANTGTRLYQHLVPMLEYLI